MTGMATTAPAAQPPEDRQVISPPPWLVAAFSGVTGWEPTGDRRWRGTWEPTGDVVYACTAPPHYAMAERVPREQVDTAVIDLEPLVYQRLENALADMTGVRYLR